MAAYGHDRRRRLSTEEMRLLYAQANGLCQDCGTALDASWHSAHMAAYVAGGATQLDRMRAQCRKCNLRLGPHDMEQVDGLHLRLWQQQAFEPIVSRLWSAGSATLHAAPGAGKTLFAAAVFRCFYDRGLVSRLVIFVPNVNLVDQTVESYARIGIHLDRKPRDGIIEHPETVGSSPATSPYLMQQRRRMQYGWHASPRSLFSTRFTTWPNVTTARGGGSSRPWSAMWPTNHQKMRWPSST